MKYRAEIDGLRALAVLPVIFYHANFSFMHRGFLGVDIFFVISGFLITSIIISDIEKRRFSFSNFYMRRIRRILPALFTVLFFSSITALGIMVPDEQVTYFKSLVASLFFYANFFFYYLLGNYFSSDAGLQPLLHIWTLAVEEQFYIILPILLLLLYRLGKRITILAVLVLFLTSLFFCLIYGREHTMFAFFMLPTRFWELAAGALLAILSIDHKILSNCALNILAWIGFILLVYSYAFVPRHISFPGWGTAPMILGTILILGFARSQTVVGKILSWKPFVWIGLISYSAYLWHQPVFAFARIYTRHENLSVTSYLILITITFILSYLTYILIEQPFRKKTFSTKRVLKYTGSFFIILAAMPVFNAVYLNQKKFENPYLDQAIFKPNMGLGNCESETCISGKNPKIALWGDSFAMQLANAFIESKTKRDFEQITLSACPPIENFSPIIEQLPNWPDKCIPFTNKTLYNIINDKKIDIVILSFNNGYTSQRTDKAILNGTIFYPTSEDTAKLIKKTFDTLVEYGKRPVLVSAVPSINFELAKQCGITSAQNSKETCSQVVDFSNFNIAYDKISKFMPVIRLDHYLCINSNCLTRLDGAPLYRDSMHMSVVGSSLFGQKYNIMDDILKAVDHYDYHKISTNN